MGNLVSLCEQENFHNCHNLGFLDVISGGPIKWDLQHLQQDFGIKEVRSLRAWCLDSLAVQVYEKIHFSGDLGLHRCQKTTSGLGELEIPKLSKSVSVVVTDDEYYLDGLQALERPGIDLGAAIGPFRKAVKDELEDDSSVDDVDLWRTRVWWTDWLNVMSDPQFDGSSVYTGPNADHWRSIQLVGFYQRIDLDPDNWWFNYEVRLTWFLRPAIHDEVVWEQERPERDLKLKDSLSFDPMAWTLWVEGGTIDGKIKKAIKKKMWSSAHKLNRKLVFGIIEQGAPFGEVLVSNLDRIAWTVMDPRPCNEHSALSCSHAQSTPPTLILDHGSSRRRAKTSTNLRATNCTVHLSPSRAPAGHEEVIDGPAMVEQSPVPLTSADGFARINDSGQAVPFGSVTELEEWVRSDLPPGKAVLLYEQTIGDKKGLLIVGGSEERMEQMRDTRERRLRTAAAYMPPEVLWDDFLN